MLLTVTKFNTCIGAGRVLFMGQAKLFRFIYPIKIEGSHDRLRLRMDMLEIII